MPELKEYLLAERKGNIEKYLIIQHTCTEVTGKVATHKVYHKADKAIRNVSRSQNKADQATHNNYISHNVHEPLRAYLYTCIKLTEGNQKKASPE